MYISDILWHLYITLYVSLNGDTKYVRISASQWPIKLMIHYVHCHQVKAICYMQTHQGVMQVKLLHATIVIIEGWIQKNLFGLWFYLVPTAQMCHLSAYNVPVEYIYTPITKRLVRKLLHIKLYPKLNWVLMYDDAVCPWSSWEYWYIRFYKRKHNYIILGCFQWPMPCSYTLFITCNMS